MSHRDLAEDVRRLAAELEGAVSRAVRAGLEVKIDVTDTDVSTFKKREFMTRVEVRVWEPL